MLPNETSPTSFWPPVAPPATKPMSAGELASRNCLRLSSEPAEGCTLRVDRKSTRLNSSHQAISYAVFCLKKKSVRGGTAIVLAADPGRPAQVIDNLLSNALKFFFFNDTATTETSPLSLHDPLPI